MPKADIIGIHVQVTVNARNGLRRVVFGLKKDTEGDQVTWTILFQLFEREKKTDEYKDALVDLNVEVDAKLYPQAEAVAKKQALTAGQAAHVIGPAADDAKAAQAGEIPQQEADGTIQATLRKK